MHARLSPADLPLAAAGRRAVRETDRDSTYLRFADDVQEARRGTVMIDDALVIPGYPSIGRILALRTGVQEQLEGPFWVEEKIDGYNVRIFKRGDEVLAVTRGGFICPFTTDRVHDLIDVRILREHPDLVICAEVAGPDNPYIAGAPPFVTRDVQLFVFDFMRIGHTGFLPHAQKTELVASYGLPGVRTFGRYRPEQWDELRELLLELGRQRCEGIVLKEDSPRERRSKYVTGESAIQDLQATARHLLQLPPEYFTQRILRLALFLEEQGIASDPELARRLGSAFLDGLAEAVEQFKRAHRVFQTYRCRLRRRENAARLMKLLRRGSGHIKIVQRRLEREGEFHVLEIEKTYPNMTGLLGHVLGGGLIYD